LVAPAFRDSLVLKSAAVYERSVEWHSLRPPV
jgi:hypothetical protein